MGCRPATHGGMARLKLTWTASALPGTSCSGWLDAVSHVFSDHGLVSFSILISLARVERKTSNRRITNPDAVHKPQLVEKVNKTIGNLETNTADVAA